jgi:hypothetical protein
VASSLSVSAGSADSLSVGVTVGVTGGVVDVVGVAVSVVEVTTSAAGAVAGTTACVVANAAVVPMNTPATVRGSASLRFIAMSPWRSGMFSVGSRLR